jgi:hypothetical protein
MQKKDRTVIILGGAEGCFISMARYVYTVYTIIYKYCYYVRRCRGVLHKYGQVQCTLQCIHTLYILY